MLPLEHNLFHFGSWMGGDRDGNPFVTPETTREVVITARLSAVNLYFQQIEQLMFDLSTWRCNAELQVSSRPSLLRPVKPPQCLLLRFRVCLRIFSESAPFPVSCGLVKANCLS